MRALREGSRSLSRQGRAFTLIELLVVIAVICVVIAVSLPTLSLGRRQARTLDCRGKLRSIAQAWEMYLGDYHGAFCKWPMANLCFGGWEGDDTSLAGIQRPLNRYLGLPVVLKSPDQAADAFQCPCDKGRPEEEDPPAFRWYGNSYQTNVLLIGDARKGWLPDANLLTELNRRIGNVTTDAVSNPSLLLLVGDHGWANCWEPRLPAKTYWHGRKCGHNLAFLDGHVSLLRIHKGLYRTDAYTVLPFADLYGLAGKVQREEECRSEEVR